ncbi:hypothetical protein G6O67_000627 [Ophiocordyceps sinensis]|uniref:Uncharacterized protein n=2 Tax=Ophiocordyceps sinensis TaxID=72228 RepID=A0A8H4V9Z2_9HYPO|nr:hypothetical protein OCS_02571 [Ophiocordyceps sinensis CO18]KAF4513349.1 hypothetical protein G6O67_000627 [Ophiocordyceps sinensis]
MATTTGAVRYSTGQQEIGDAKNFEWECPVPVNRFWDDLNWKVGRSFLQAHRADELAKLPIDPDSAQPVKEKLELLLKLLRTKLDDEEAANAPGTYYDADYKAWTNTWQGIMTLQHELDDPDEEQTLRMMTDRRKDKDNLSELHTLSGLLLAKGKYAQVQANEAPVRDWLDAKLGKHSPQAISARHMIAEAVWKQDPDRRVEATELFSELNGIIDGMSGTEYEVYQDEYREIVNESLEALKGGG